MGNMFLSYRRDDSGTVCGRIADSLRNVFGTNSVFRDVSAIPGGVDFRKSVDSALSQSQVVVALIGPAWATVTDQNGRRRLDNPDDSVRVEIESALVRRIPILPVLVLGAKMPPAQVLPPSIAQLSFLNAYEVHDDPLYQGDIQRVIMGVAYFIPLLPTDQSRLQQQANQAFIGMQQLGRQVAPVAKTVWTGAVVALLIFGAFLCISSFGMYAYGQSLAGTASSLIGTDPVCRDNPAQCPFQGIQDTTSSFFNTFSIISIGMAIFGLAMVIWAIVLLRRSYQRRAAGQ